MSDKFNPKIAQLSLPRDDGFHRATNKPLLVLLSVLGLGVGSYLYYDKSRQQLAPIATGMQLGVITNAGDPARQSDPVAQTSYAALTTAQGKPKGKVLDASGHIIARRVATISSLVTSKVETLQIEEGQLVEANDVLAQLDGRQAKYHLAGAEAELLAGNASLGELYSRLTLAEIQLKRIESLLGNKVVTQEELDTTRLLVTQLNAQIDYRKALNQKALQQVKLASYNVDQHIIRAPFSGMVIQKNAQVGELISGGMSGGGSIRTGIATIVDMSSLEIEVDVAESFINRISPGQPAVAHLDAYPDWTIKSEVLTIIPTANRQKATIKVRVKLLETDARILPDMAVKVSFLAAK
ncbi:efflux RND transporter periplasmic adaptor subunit [Arsukibacterium sp.]|uniref:efflux RND transporter periplasmic adaptor subunit n=1 Tax=Arsukibacterium sp. TaxID=1977258 RepID=UPI002FD8D835